MSEEHAVIFSGEIAEDLDIDLVKSDIASKLNITRDNVDKLFDTAPKSIKIFNTLEGAEKLVSFFRSCGAVCTVDTSDKELLSGLNVTGNEGIEEENNEEETLYDIVKGYKWWEWAGVAFLIYLGFSFVFVDGANPGESTVASSNPLTLGGDVNSLARKTSSFIAVDPVSGKKHFEIFLKGGKMFLPAGAGARDYQGYLVNTTDRDTTCIGITYGRLTKRQAFICEADADITKPTKSFSGNGEYNFEVSEGDLFFWYYDAGSYENRITADGPYYFYLHRK